MKDNVIENFLAQQDVKLTKLYKKKKDKALGDLTAYMLALKRKELYDLDVAFMIDKAKDFIIKFGFFPNSYRQNLRAILKAGQNWREALRIYNGKF